MNETQNFQVQKDKMGELVDGLAVSARERRKRTSALVRSGESGM